MIRSCLVFLTTLIAGLALAKEEPLPALDKAALERARRPVVMLVHGGVPGSRKIIRAALEFMKAQLN